MQYTYIFSSIMTRCALYKAETVGVAKARLAHMLSSLTVREVSYRFFFFFHVSFFKMSLYKTFLSVELVPGVVGELLCLL